MDIHLSYSYRIDRPSYNSLNPFTFINNPYSYFRGNPYLQPQYTHNIEGNYVYKKIVFVTLGYSRTANMITEISERGIQPDVIGATRTNLNSMDSYNISFSVQLHPLKRWDLNLNAGGFKNSIKDGEGFLNSHSTFTASMSSSITLFKGIAADVNGSYQTSMSYGTILLDPMYSVNGGLKRSFLSNKLSVRLSVSDVFNLQRMKFHSDYTGIQRYGLNTSESRVGRIAVSYKFGKIKGVSKRDTGANDEKQRAGN